MRRNSGIINSFSYTPSLTRSSGVFDSFDAYNAKKSNIWPATPKYSKSVTASSYTMYNNGPSITITNTSDDVPAGTTLYWTLETISAPTVLYDYVCGTPYATTVLRGAFTQGTGVNGTGQFSIYPATDKEPNPTLQPIQFTVSIRTDSVTGPIVNTTSIITIPTPIPTLNFVPYLSSYTQFDETQSGWYLTLTWANVGTSNTVSEKIYSIAYSGTATTQDLIYYPTYFSNGVDNNNYDGISGYIYGKKDYLTEGTEPLTITVTSAQYGWTLGTVNINIIDTSTTPTTTITPSATTVEKGTTIRFDVAIQNAQETTIYYIITGSAASKFSPQSGNFQLSAGGITLTALNNFNYSEAETTFQVQFRAQSTSGYLYGTSQVITVTTPLQPTATIVPIASINEGTTNAFVVNTTNYSGTLNWVINQLANTSSVLSNTMLLTAQSTTLVDNGSYNYSMYGTDIYGEGSGVYATTTTYSGQSIGIYVISGVDSLVITPSNPTNFDFDSSDWTFETWINPQLQRLQCIYSKGYFNASPNAGPLTVILTASNVLRFACSLDGTSSTFDKTGTISVPTNTWSHIAIVREGTTFRGYVNGVLDSALTTTGISGALAYNSSYPTIGGTPYGLSSYNFYGYLRNLRIVKGAALYTNDFTPPSIVATLPIYTTSGLVKSVPTVSDFFTVNSGTLTVTNGGSSTITVKPRADTFTEGAETFKLTVSLTNNTELTSSDFIVNDTSTGTAEPVDLYNFSTFKFLSGHNYAADITYGGGYGNNTATSLATFLASIYSTSRYPWLNNTSYYNVTSGIQQWTVPFTGVYRFKVAGAKGGNWVQQSQGGTGGLGAILNGDVLLTRGQVVNIVVGKQGANAGTTGVGGGGGGGTFVYTGSVGGTGLIFAAGGGGGADDDGLTAGQSAREDFYAGLNSASIRATPTDGQGAANAGAGGGSGTGWFSDGLGSGAGLRFNGGGAVGEGGIGGFGGGGGDLDDGGAGGGYTGGTSSTTAAGGCGGSYYNLQLVNNYSWGGSNTSNGYVEVTAISTGATAVITPTASSITEGQSVTFNIVTTGFISGTLYYNLIANTGSISINEFGSYYPSVAGSVTITDSVGQVTLSYTSDSYTEGTEAISLLVYYNTGGIRYTVGTSSQVTISDTSTGSAPVFSVANIVQYNPQGLTAYELSTALSTTLNFSYPAKGWTLLTNATATADSYVSIPLPFSFKINNTNFTNVLVNENAWMVFGTTGTALSAGFVNSTAASAVPYNKLVWSGGNNTMQRLLYRVDAQNRFILIRYEGNASTSGTVGSPGIVAEIKLFNPQFTGGISMIEMKYQTNRTVSSTSHSPSLSSPSAYYAYYTHPYTNTQYNLVYYANNAEATIWSVAGSYGSPYAVVI